jgi:hypothetical protein
MNKMILVSLLISLLLAACSPVGTATPTSTPIPFKLNEENDIKQYLIDWEPQAQKIGYGYEVLDVVPEKDAKGDITSWVISIKSPQEPYLDGICIAPIMGMVGLVKNYADSGRGEQINSIAPATLETIKTVCFDSNLVQQQIVSTKFADIVSLSKGNLTSEKMLTRLTMEP